MHQSHNIPWEILPSLFKVIFDDIRLTPPCSHISPKVTNDPNIQPKLVHLIRKITSSIRMFSQTERKKYPATFKPQMDGRLFSDDLMNRYPEYLNEENQDIKHWIDSVLPDSPTGFKYSSGRGDLADVIKILIHANQMDTLLMLAQHPLIPVADLHWMSYGHHFGWSRSKEEALWAYLYFNSAEALGVLEGGGYARLKEYGFLLDRLGRRMDFRAQQVTHTQFFGDLGIHDGIENMEAGKIWQKDGCANFVVHKDYHRYTRYIKEVFEVMYRYDMLASECGLDTDESGRTRELNWECEIAKTFPFDGYVQEDATYLEHEKKWSVFLKPR